MTAATADTAADYGPDLASVLLPRQHDSLTAMTAAWFQPHEIRALDAVAAPIGTNAAPEGKGTGTQ